MQASTQIFGDTLNLVKRRDEIRLVFMLYI